MDMSHGGGHAMAVFAGVTVVAAALSALLILSLKPLLQRYALARPNARSSHRIPTPQGGGIAVIAAALVCAAAGLGFSGLGDALPRFTILAIGAVGLAVIGAIDDIRPLPALLRLVFQAAAVAAVMASAGAGQLFPILPPAVEWIIIGFAGIWFVNLVNFMDGLDWMTVAEMTPLTAALALFSVAGWLDPVSGVIAAALLGGIIGFAPFNRPVARLFLGDVGSLPIGLIVGFLLYRLAGEGGFAAAVLLPLYYLTDATVTLLRRLARRERVWEAHRTHFYQQATDNGWPVLAVATRVAGLNVALALLAAASLAIDIPLFQAVVVIAGFGLVAATLRAFARPR
ncbi:UDP-N-acetylmuramyl pentapeptide phosphotransferase/UDP-N-acetylglucosamine-1-phosphate transferase [Pseudochelatococcus contaminans]|uniref:UDP-N-acetylmuramyl pentapeptide phosphotransferase/UDP-N-acetylglucosamine-1-phosphate transferase n=2 Tax=Pseudochelatococcus contaminans TaxID=1538103 RepID=A0A7W6EGZ7_9HYPH|nr:glycosyl transferase [Pseudochelatococcus contaminans]MBB3809794.1 UDP-N-acetylmuramyl pentapeptide phosphotransferase/UDP-N-acetylglucosamine-1-phosphate transferase [Pseudochelatococcus contaminans]